jgi:hypothetical protein
MCLNQMTAQGDVVRCLVQIRGVVMFFLLQSGGWSRSSPQDPFR